MGRSWPERFPIAGMPGAEPRRDLSGSGAAGPAGEILLMIRPLPRGVKILQRPWMGQDLTLPFEIAKIALRDLVRPRPNKTPSGLDSAPDWRLCPEFGKIATQNLIRPL